MREKDCHADLFIREHQGGIHSTEHLYRCIRADILAGRLQAGEKLPSKRSLARQLGISVITVEGAYGQLVAEGYCQSVPKKGFFVAHLASLPVLPARPRRMPAEPEAHKAAYLADFTANSLRPEDFPFKTWTRLLRQVMAQQAEELLVRSPGMGIMGLRETIADHLRSFRSLDVARADRRRQLRSTSTACSSSSWARQVFRSRIPADKIRAVYRQHAVRCVPVATSRASARRNSRKRASRSCTSARRTTSRRAASRRSAAAMSSWAGRARPRAATSSKTTMTASSA